jgi:hypothetical protein
MSGRRVIFTLPALSTAEQSNSRIAAQSIDRIYYSPSLDSCMDIIYSPYPRSVIAFHPIGSTILPYTAEMSFHVDVIEKGYFPVEIPPAFSSSSFAGATGYFPTDLNQFAKKFSRCAFHSIPRLQHHRRMLGIPNPLHQLKLVVLLETYWSKLESHMKKSTLSMTRMQYISSSKRGLEKVNDFDVFDRERVIRSSSSRFLLKADLSRFYHTLYTHSIPWSLHKKDVAKARQFDKTLYGNLIDEAVRNTQDKQTLAWLIHQNRKS